jgi:tetratricopeptide (TPR) repeat protein
VYVLAGKALFNQRKLADARQRFESARGLRPTDVQIRGDLVLTINEQAFDAKDTKASQQMLTVAIDIDPHSAITLTNLAVLELERGDCDGALRQLGELRDVRGTDTVVVARLRGRALLCAAKPDPKKAAEAFALAEREAKQASAQLALAEIYTEWAPLLWDTDANAAVDKLEQALTIAASNPDVAPVARRNLALALYRRGWKLAHDGRAADAAADFDRALRDPTALQGSEPLAFQLSLAFAQLDANRTAEATKQFKQLAAAGNTASYLKPTFAKIGAVFFPAYSSYRTSTGSARQQACSALSRLEGDLGAKARELVASCW